MAGTGARPCCCRARPSNLGLEHPLFLNLRAFWLEGRGRMREALADLERARDLAPDDVPVLNALGLAYAKLERPVEATEAFEAAIAAQPDFVPAHFNHGWACEMWGELDRARASYERAAELSKGQPGSGESLARLASLAARLGDWDEVRQFATDALHFIPSHPIAHLALARADIEAGDFAAAEAGLQRILSAPSISPHDRYHAMGALGDLRHRQGDYAGAFDAYAASNAQYRNDVSARFQGGETAMDALVWMQRYFDNRAPASAPKARPVPPLAEAEQHVFLLGFIRSGTTLLEQTLAAHSNVLSMEEKEVMDDFRAASFS